MHVYRHDHGGSRHDTAPAGGGPGQGSAYFGRAFAIGLVLNLGFVIIEASYGVLADSLALLADAGHNLSDVFSLLLAWGAVWLSGKAPTRRRTYGFLRSSILASLINAAVLLIAVGGIVLESVKRFQTPAPVESGTVLWVAAAGIVINTVTALMFMSGRHHDLNIKGAFQHMAADAAVSAGVVIAALAIMQTGWLWLDPAASLLIAAVITVGTWGLLRDSINLALDAVPAGIDPAEVEHFLASQPGVSEVHDLHIWGMSTTEIALTAHLVRADPNPDDDFLAALTQTLHYRFGIHHPTIQIESGGSDHACHLAPAHVV